jgi:hypothetical protein
MDRSSRSDATASCSLTAARSFPFSSRESANSVAIAERRTELERARKQAFTLEQLQQPTGAGFDEAPSTLMRTVIVRARTS